ncbi:MAG: integrase core domain-containing protein [Spirochaetota bacterium]
MAKFEVKCEKDGVKLYVIPPKSTKYNGKVDRLQRSCKFYSRYEGANLKEIREELDEQMYNRPHMGLGNLTPFEYYAELQEAEPFLSHMY